MNSPEEREARSVGEQAAEWLLRLEDGAPEDREAFADWIARSPLHIDAFLRAATMDTLLSRVDPEHAITLDKLPLEQSVSELRSDHASSTRANKPPASAEIAPRTGSIAANHGVGGRSLNTRRWALAAGIAAAAAVGGGAWWQLTDGTRGNWQLATAVGEQRVLELEDGSVLHLNTNSKVAVKFTRQERRVDLIAGEALFRIHGEPARPFRVHSGPAVIEALGTQFNVYRRQGDAVVSVIEGAVRVSNDISPAAAASSAVRLDAGEEAHVAGNGEVSAKSAADVSRVSAWRQRRLIFKDEPLSVIATEFNRYNRTPKIRIEGEGIGDRRYAAAFDADDPESLMGILRKDATLEVEQQADELVIRAR